MSTEEKQQPENSNHQGPQDGGLDRQNDTEHEQTGEDTKNPAEQKPSRFYKVATLPIQFTRRIVRYMWGMATSYEAKKFYISPMVWLEVGALSVLIVYTVFTGRLVRITNNTLSEVKKQSTSSELAAKAAMSAAETSLDALNRNIDQFRIDERAWVEIDPIKPILVAPPSPPFGYVYRYEVYPKNMGRTAAFDVTVKAQSSQSDISMGTHADWMHNWQDKMLLDKFTYMGTGKPVIVPRNPVTRTLAPNTISAVPFILTGQEPTIYPTSEMVSFLVGRIDYLDQFKVPHWLKFCFFVANARGELWNCQEGNDEDRNPETPPTPEKKR